MSKRIIEEDGHIYDPEATFTNLTQSIEKLRPQHLNNDESNYLLEQIKKLSKNIELSKINNKIKEKLPDVKVIKMELLSRKCYMIERINEELLYSIGDVGDVDIYISNKNDNQNNIKFYTSKVYLGPLNKNAHYISELPSYAIDILMFLCEYE